MHQDDISCDDDFTALFNICLLHLDRTCECLSINEDHMNRTLLMRTISRIKILFTPRFCLDVARSIIYAVIVCYSTTSCTLFGYTISHANQPMLIINQGLSVYCVWSNCIVKCLLYIGQDFQCCFYYCVTIIHVAVFC